MFLNVHSEKPRDNNTVCLVKITSMINFQQSGRYMEAEIADFSLKTEEKKICIDIRQKTVYKLFTLRIL